MSNCEAETGFDFGCQFPESCVMPGTHLKSECCTMESLEVLQEKIWQEDDEQCLGDLSFWFDHLSHDCEASEWPQEIEDGYVRTPRGNIDLRILILDPCLADPDKAAWNKALIWQVIAMFGETALVCFRRKPTPEQKALTHGGSP